ncbi:hypothetical protein [Streptomyces diacarni]|uniref:hypothetical protein n=1 Tax=Streptomyces diacarni TaxID=2800381 RepID=UPI0011C06A6F|nr:hypothetical protein [Streptomyces diacarni]
MQLGSGVVSSQGCYYLVDGMPAVDVSGEWVKPNDEAAPSTPYEAVMEHKPVDKPRKYPGRYEVVTWGKGAVAGLDCARAPGDDDASFTRYLIDIYANDTELNDDPDRAHKTFGKLAQVVMAEAAGKLTCAGG